MDIEIEFMTFVDVDMVSFDVKVSNNGSMILKVSEFKSEAS